MSIDDPSVQILNALHQQQELLMRMQCESLFAKYSQYPRLQEELISFDGRTLIIPDPNSFVRQLRDIFLSNTYQFSTTALEPLIIDCGANVGTSVLYFKKYYPTSRVIAFEPDKKLFGVLQSNLQGLDNVGLYQKAVWINNEDITFYSEGTEGGTICAEVGSGETVSAIRLKNILEQEKNIAFLKVDIEGAEVEVFKDCESCLGNVENIFVEYHGHTQKPQELAQLLEILTKNGFRYYIETTFNRPSPFVNRYEHQLLELLVNIFAYKKG